MKKKLSQLKLALYGGKPLRSKKFPNRFLFNFKEKIILEKIINNSLKTGKPIRYSEKYENIYNKKFTKFMGGGYVDLVNSGTNAILCSLASLNLKPGSEVIVPVITDVGCVTPIVMLNLIPIPVDVQKNNYNTSLIEIKKKITKNTSAVIICHIGGIPADIIPIQKYLKKKSIYLIEDCSQSHGATISNIKVGSFGHISIFSTMSTKLHCTGGQGGIVYSKNLQLINKSRRFADRGKLFVNNKFTKKYIDMGINCNIDEISAAIGTVQISKLPSIIKKTNLIGEGIRKELIKIDSPSQIFISENIFPVYWFLTVNLNLKKINVSKKVYCAALSSEGLNIDEKYSYNPFFHQWFKKKNFNVFFNNYYFNIKKNKKLYFPNYNYVINNNYNIYMHENYSNKDIKDVINIIKKVDLFFMKK